ncbi:MAG: OprO/OprP family phosphate-selective porin [Prevotellaceae bacterium]|jgi:hypothetical protein|nr:OprO/OprP family phosphate-selective porin [Prevotellaceae bacterium]
MKRNFLVFTVLILLPFVSLAQQADSSFSYVPKINGLVKAKWEYAFEDNTNRFDIRSMRLGASGNISPYISYRVQVEYSSNSNKRDVYLIDAAASFTPSARFSFSLGQFSLPFSDDHVISPAANNYVNRPLIGKYVNVGASMRDIGALAQYNFIGKVPITLQAGLFNGAGANKTDWQESPAILGRVIYGEMEGFRGSVKCYTRKDTLDKRVRQYGIDFRYAKDRYRIETEFVIKDSVSVKDSRLYGSYLQGTYSFPIGNSKLLKYVEPNLRGDAMGFNVFDNGFDISRLTFGLNFGLAPKKMNAELRLNYEKLFFSGSKLGIQNDARYAGYFTGASNKPLSDRLTIELYIKF